MGLRSVLGRALGHTRRVTSGNYPLYRILIVCSLAAAVAQAMDRNATMSVSAIAPTWFDWSFIGAQAVASLMVLWALYSYDEANYDQERFNDSLNLEFIGLLFMQTVITVNLVAVMFYYGRPPTSQGSWLQIGLWFWIWFRAWEIWRTMRGLRK